VLKESTSPTMLLQGQAQHLENNLR